MSAKVGKGASSKSYSFREGQKKDYKKMNQGKDSSVADKGARPKTPRPPLLVSPEGPEKEDGASKSSKITSGASDLTVKEISDLDREIDELETSIVQVKSRLKEASLPKERRERSDRVAKLRRELFVAEQQLQPAACCSCCSATKRRSPSHQGVHSVRFHCQVC